MKDLLLSVCCMLLLLVPWEIYSSYTAGTMHFCSDAIDAKVLPAVTQNDWENAKKGFEEVSDQWDHYKKTAVCFLSTEALNEVDSTICKAYYYIQMEDDSNASGEVSALQYQLMYLHENQKPTLANIL